MFEIDNNTKWNCFVLTMITICCTILLQTHCGHCAANVYAAGGTAGNSVAAVAGSGSPGADEPHFQIQVAAQKHLQGWKQQV